MINEERQIRSLRIDKSTVLRPFVDEREFLEKFRRTSSVESILVRLFDLLKLEDYRLLFATVDRDNLTRKSLELFSALCMKRYLECGERCFNENYRCRSESHRSLLENYVKHLRKQFELQFSIRYFHLIIDQLVDLNRFKIVKISTYLNENDLLIKKIFSTVINDESVVHLRSTNEEKLVYSIYKPTHIVYPETKVLINNDTTFDKIPSDGLTKRFISDLSQVKSLEIFHPKLGKTFDISTKRIYFQSFSPGKTILPLKLRVLVLDPTDGKHRYGLIGEESSKNNRFRSLVFYLDDQSTLSAFYYSSEQIRIGFQQDLTSNEFEFENAFFQSYFRSYPERMMLRVKEGTQIEIRLENDGNFVPAIVRQIDCSMISVEICSSEKRLWVYRGSKHLQQIKSFYSTPQRHSARQHLSVRKSNVPELFYDNDESTNSISNDDEIAAKRRRISTTNQNAIVSHSKIIPNAIFLELTQHFLLHFDRDFYPHECSPRCVAQAEKYFHNLPRTINPFLKPFACQWTSLENFRIRKGNDVRVKSNRSIIIYCAPCGRKLCNESQVDQYLHRTKSKLSIELFVFDSAINLKQSFCSGGRLISSDISEGQENVPISVVNEIDDDEPEHFVYRVERTPVQGVRLITNEPTMTCCSCTDGCRDRTKCACWLKTLKNAELIGDERVESMKAKNKSQAEILYQLGYGFRRLHKNVPGGIYECNSRCSCQQETCSNRVVQNGIVTQLQLFKTAGRGWGVRTLHDIPLGTFISVYSGEIFTSEQADERGKLIGDEYQADLDFFENINDDDSSLDEEGEENRSPISSTKKSSRTSSVSLRSRERSRKNSTQLNDTAKNRTVLPDYDGTVYTLDAKLIGNIGRYFNHSCSPNIAVQNVFVDTHDIHFPWIGFFTTKLVRAGTELCWDYNYTVGEIAGRRIDCNCGSSECRRRML